MVRQVCGTCRPKHVLNRLHSASSAEDRHACRQHMHYPQRSKRKSTVTNNMSFLQTLISLRPSEICPNVNFPRFRCPSECIFSLPGQVHRYFVHASAIHRVRQVSYSVPLSINNFTTFRWWRWKKLKLTMAQINITLTLGVKKEVYLKENDQICTLLRNTLNDVNLHRLCSIEWYNDWMINWEVVETKVWQHNSKSQLRRSFCLEGVRIRITNRRDSRLYLGQISNTVTPLCKPEALGTASGTLRILVALDWTRLRYRTAKLSRDFHYFRMMYPALRQPLTEGVNNTWTHQSPSFTNRFTIY
jgi:hypothetical protein